MDKPSLNSHGFSSVPNLSRSAHMKPVWTSSSDANLDVVSEDTIITCSPRFSLSASSLVLASLTASVFALSLSLTAIRSNTAIRLHFLTGDFLLVQSACTPMFTFVTLITVQSRQGYIQRVFRRSVLLLQHWDCVFHI